MGIPKTILYPFIPDTQFFAGYVWAVELALRLNAKLQLFTVIPGQNEATSDTVYQSLLAAHGYYLHHFLHNVTRQERVVRERNIATGELREELVKYLKKNTIDIMIIDPVFHSRYERELREIIKESRAAIILSENPANRDRPPDAPISEYFYEQLERAEFYKIQENFFSVLGKDRSSFNYLRNYFQKNPN